MILDILQDISSRIEKGFRISRSTHISWSPKYGQWKMFVIGVCAL